MNGIKSFTVRIDSCDFDSLIEDDVLTTNYMSNYKKIITGLSFEWNVYCSSQGTNYFFFKFST